MLSKCVEDALRRQIFFHVVFIYFCEDGVKEDNVSLYLLHIIYVLCTYC